ncbi:MAG: hypothetical protein Q4A44_01170 [Bacteroidales bacterium]|nr:hypothetical protein [Bacteroidales bacterium]
MTTTPLPLHLPLISSSDTTMTNIATSERQWTHHWAYVVRLLLGEIYSLTQVGWWVAFLLLLLVLIITPPIQPWCIGLLTLGVGICLWQLYRLDCEPHSST